ncbi:MAG TPA: RNA polymerase sigma-70 factor [Pedobacter sp.]|uniref:RNA polymerase sigma factor n=1 Tax=Pedobacter sp. TaxID=1411316 RepID=UPI002C1DEE46|nr:RNA polymerase sigma-70 factor [Pedobacter sp.]HMI04004.1 RNA polymerase sigma-70 factor [Pedobacter sp.]
MTDHRKLTDQELAGLLRLGNETAFKVVYDRYWEKLYFVAAKRLNDAYEAEEAVQDIFLQLWKNRENFELRETFENYLAVAAKFQVIKRRSKRLRRAIIDQQLASEAELRNLDSNHHNWSQYDFEQLQQKLSKILDGLPPKCKLVFSMSRDDEYTNKKIAAELGISEKAVEKHVTHALKTLKSKLGNYFLLVLWFNEMI